MKVRTNVNKNDLRIRTVPLALIALALSIWAFSQTAATPAADAPVYAAKIKVHIAYGFMSAHKLDLEVGTNSDGKARFTGLPDHLKRGLFFEASEGDRIA